MMADSSSYDDGGYYYLTQDGETTFGSVRAAPDSVLVFNSQDGSWSVDTRYDEFTPTASKVLEERKYYGIIGVINLEFEKLVVVITDRELAARIKGRSVWRVTGIRFITVFKRTVLTLDQEEHERVITQSLTRLLTSGQTFYSIDVDLTNGPQRFLQKGFRQQSPLNFPNCDSDYESLLRQIEKRFLFNRRILAPLLRPEAAPFILPIVHGFVGSTTLTLDNSKIHIVVVSRIATLRPSILECGVDHNGEAAREVETETMIFSRKRISSFRMVRGSVPLFWTSDDEEDATAFEFLKSPESKEALERHLNMLSTFYGGDIAVVDLLRLDKKIEVTLGRALEDCLLAMNRNDVEYFHCNGAAIKPGTCALSRFLKELQRPLSRQQFFSSAIDGLGAFIGKSTSQRGIFRVDCFDGIDFTNIMQYHIALEAISKMLDFMKLPCLLSKTDLNKVALLWAANGDSLSMSFMGTTSLPSKRNLYISSAPSLISWSISHAKDAVISITRSYLENIQRDNRQESYDILFGDEFSMDFAAEDQEDDSLQALKRSKLAILKRTCTTMKENSQMTPIATILFLRRILAPKEIKNMRTFGAAFIWVALFKVMKKVYPEAMKFRRSSSCAAMFALPTGLQKAPYRSSIADILDAFGESGQKNPAPVRKMSQ